MSEGLSQILEARKSSHGEFRNNSEISQLLKAYIRQGKKWVELDFYQKEALDMIMHKIGRILEGDPMFQDHWDDIGGYAKLAADRVREDNKNGR